MGQVRGSCDATERQCVIFVYGERGSYEGIGWHRGECGQAGLGPGARELCRNRTCGILVHPHLYLYLHIDIYINIYIYIYIYKERGGGSGIYRYRHAHRCPPPVSGGVQSTNGVGCGGRI